MMKHARRRTRRRFQSESRVRQAARRAVMEAWRTGGCSGPATRPDVRGRRAAWLTRHWWPMAWPTPSRSRRTARSSRRATFGDGPRFALVRYNPDGSTDTSFGANGVVRTVLPGSQWSGERRRHPVGREDRRRGYSRYSGVNRFAAVRYLPNGRLDARFSDDGVATLEFGPGDDQAEAVAIQPGTGKSCSRVHEGRPGRKPTRRRPAQPDGPLDTTFNSTGNKRRIAGGRMRASVLVGDDGKITSAARPRNLVTTGRTLPGPPHPVGALDPTFDGDGRTTPGL